MKNILKIGFILSALLPLEVFAQGELCKEGDPNCKVINPFEMCREVDANFDRKLIARDEILAMKYDSCVSLGRIQCVQAAEVFVKSYKNILETYTGNKQSDRPVIIGLVGEFPFDKVNLNIFSNFRKLKALHSEIFLEIVKAQEEFVKSLDQVETLENAQSARNSLRDRTKSIKNLLVKASFHDRVFLNLIDQSQQEFTGVVMAAQGVLSRANCNVLREPVDKITKDSAQYYDEIRALKSYVAKSTIKRSMALEKFKRGMELAIYARYADRVGKTLDQIMAEIGPVFVLDSVLWEITEWWMQATSKGLAGRFHTEFLQYKKPIDILTSQLGKAEHFKNKILNISGLESQASKSAIAIVDDKITTIKNDLDFLQKRGWQGQLERQKIFAKKRQEIVPASNNACHEETSKFFSLSNSVENFEQYELVEAQYKRHYDACAKKG